MNPRISVAIPTMGRETLVATLRSLEKQTVPPYEVLVLNQGTGEVESGHRFDLPIKWHYFEERGLSRARNRALECFTGDWVLFTDDDQEVGAEWVEQLGVLTDAYPEASIIGGAVLPPLRYDTEKEFVSQLYPHGEMIVNADTYLTPGDGGALHDVWGGNFGLSRACVERVGPYDGAFGRGSGLVDAGEDTDYMLRVLSAGLTGLLSCRMIIYHTYGGRPHSPQMTVDTVQVAAAIYWKSLQEDAKTRADLAERLLPYGKKKALLARFSGSRLFSGHRERQRIFDDMLATLDREWAVKDGLLARKGP